MYASSKGTIKLADMRESALCDQHAKRKSFTPLRRAYY
jgi:serine/threonine-protein phosphatase 2A regulatory subunit B